MSEPDIQIQRDYPQTLVNSQWVKWAAERIAELESYVTELERDCQNLFEECRDLRLKVKFLEAKPKSEVQSDLSYGRGGGPG